jgi:hypothetical protein
LITIAATLTMFNVEMDLSYLTITLAQTFAALLIIAAMPSPTATAASLGTNDPAFTEVPSPRQ